MSGFDENCPHCLEPIPCLEHWTNSDHRDNFQVVCGECDGLVAVTVRMVPEFCTDRVRCLMCHKITDSPDPYCEVCRSKLAAMEAASKKGGER